ncbi:MAG: M15 family metallopeptidase [Saprospiraceae bacterium]|nr:M15 family metallopeptidase [Saprospiraceae bacterium]
MRLLLGFISLVLTACSQPAGKGGPPAGASLSLATSPAEPTQQPSAAFDTDYLMGRFDPAKHPDFTLVAPSFASREGMYLRKDTYEAFQRMHEAAKQDGINLLVISATRNFDYQKGLWEAKWTGRKKVDGQDLTKTIPDPQKRALKILEYSAMPGASRHHWGTDIDLNSLEDEHFLTGEGKKVYGWLVANASAFGFCQPYSAGRTTGYHEEKWHWSYTPVAAQLTQLAAEKLQDKMITGFAGAEAAPAIRVVENYVLGINPECK